MTLKFALHGKILDRDGVVERLQARNAAQEHSDANPPGREDPALGHPDVEVVAQWRRGLRPGGFEVEPRRTLLARRMQGCALRNLTQMNFHNVIILTNFPQSANRERGGGVWMTVFRPCPRRDLREGTSNF